MAPLWIVLAGCAGSLPADGSDGTAVEDQLSDNGLTSNSLTFNSLTFNSLTSNSLTFNSLTASALMTNSLTAQALQDPAARTVLTYIAGCALPAGAHFDVVVNGVSYGYDGQLGLAASWGNSGGHCDATCQGWVSGCVIARLNYQGVRVPISVRGEHFPTSAAEMSAYPVMDGTYYGNVFTQPQTLLACLPPGATLLPRVCGPTTLDGCAVKVAGACTQTCDAQRADGSFPDCRNEPKYLPGAKVIVGPVTVYVE